MTDRRASQRVIIVIRLRKGPSCASRSTLCQNRRSRLVGLFLASSSPLSSLSFSFSFCYFFFLNPPITPPSPPGFVSGQSSCLEDSLETLATFAARNTGNVREIKLGLGGKGDNRFREIRGKLSLQGKQRSFVMRLAAASPRCSLLGWIQLTLQPLPVTKKSVFFFSKRSSRT